MVMKRFSWFIIPFLIESLAFSLTLRASDAVSTCQVEFSNDRLTVNADHTPLGVLLKAIQEKTGIEFVVADEQSKGIITAQLGPLPVEEVVRRVLSGINHSFLLNAENRLMKVIIIGSSTGAGSSPRAAGVSHTTVDAGGRQDGISEIPKPSTGGAGAGLPEGMVVYSGEKKGSGSSSGNENKAAPPAAAPMVIQPATEKMVVQPSSGGMAVQPAGETKMVVTPPTEPMVIQLPNGESLSVKEPKKTLSTKPAK
jgi:hypothetical protein